VPDPIQVSLLNPLPQQGLGQPAAENLRRLASRYVNHPDSQVDTVRMEPSSTSGRYKVVIALETAGLPCPCLGDNFPVIAQSSNSCGARTGSI